MIKILVLLSMISIVLVTGCIQTDVKQTCIDACKHALSSGQDLSDGPCLLNPIPKNDWVCDVAHSPRQPVDDSPQNQCSSYGTTANHFVEVAPSCEFIRSV